MQVKKKRAKSYKPRTISLNTMKVATNRQSILTDTEKSPLLVEARGALDRLRTGRLDHQSWSYLADAANVGEALSIGGICSDAPSMAILIKMQLALKAIAERVNGRGIWSAKGTELVAITEGLERHELQLEFCSLHELRVAVDKVKRDVRAAREGRMTAVTIVAPSFDHELEAA